MSHAAWKAPHCGLAAALMLTATAEAQNTPAGDASGPAQLEEVTVTATRAETNLQQTPIAVTAISGQSLAERNATSLLDIANYVPSLSIGSRSGTSTENGSISIRGMGIDATGSSPAVGIYVDDVYFASGPGNLLGLLDVDRVEVLRGPQGTLFGRNTIAGAIQYVSHAPDQELGGYVTATGGNDSRADFQGVLNIPMGDTFAVRVAASATYLGGYVHDLHADLDRGADRTQTARIRARWTPTDRLTVDLKAEVIHEMTNGRAVLVSGVNPNSEFVGLAELFGETRPLTNAYISPNNYTSIGFNSPDYFHFDYDEGQAIISYALSDTIKFKSISAYSWSRPRLAQDFDDTPLAILSALPAHDNIDVFTQEFQFTGDQLAHRLNWTAGAYYYDSTEQQNPGQGIVLGFAPVSYPYGNPETDIDSRALYGQATYKLTDTLSAAAGLRYSRETTTASLIGGTLHDSATFSDTSSYFSLNFQLDPDVMLYAKASKGFRAGGITPSAALPGGGLAFGPETAWTYEGGARTEFLDHRLRVNPTVFLTDWKDIQFNALIPTPTTVVAATQNAGDARIKGFELESQFAATDRLTLNGSLSLLDGYYTRVAYLPRFIYPDGFLATFSGAPGTTVVLPNLTVGTPLMRAPKTKVDVGARYSLPVSTASRVVGSLDYSWTAEQYSAVTISDAVVMPSYGVLNARFQYNAPNDRWSVALFGTNLTNKFYLLGGVDFAKGYTTGATELDPARPREYGAELLVHF
jgi:iron complex outermembrane receptor protein